MNRRDFLKRFSAVPIAATLVEPITRTIFLPPRGGWPGALNQLLDSAKLVSYPRGVALHTASHSFSNTLATPAELSEASLERLLMEISRLTPSLVIQPDRLIVSPQIKRQIDDDPVLQRYVRETFG